jgi:hypothetical protein
LKSFYEKWLNNCEDLENSLDRINKNAVNNVTNVRNEVLENLKKEVNVINEGIDEKVKSFLSTFKIEMIEENVKVKQAVT